MDFIKRTWGGSSQKVFKSFTANALRLSLLLCGGLVSYLPPLVFTVLHVLLKLFRFPHALGLPEVSIEQWDEFILAGRPHRLLEEAPKAFGHALREALRE